jgi:hypothetical protein
MAAHPALLQVLARICGEVAQLGERGVRNAEVESSSLFFSTNYREIWPLIALRPCAPQRLFLFLHPPDPHHRV